MSDPTPPEPGMDEILASIRRIISNDQPGSETSKTAWPDGPLVLTQRVTPRPAPPPSDAAPKVHAPAVPGVLDSRGPDGPVFIAPVSDASPIVHRDAHIEETHTLVTAKQPDTTQDHAIVDDRAAAGAASSFDKLSDVVRGNVGAPPPIALPPEGRTLEDLMRDMLQPMLKAWLDENLPAIVEARVDEEVERISRRRVR